MIYLFSLFSTITCNSVTISGCKFTDEVIIYDREAEVLDILDKVDWDVRIIGEEYKEKQFTGRKKTLEKCYFNKRPHNFSSSELNSPEPEYHVPSVEKQTAAVLFIKLTATPSNL